MTKISKTDVEVLPLTVRYFSRSAIDRGELTADCTFCKSRSFILMLPLGGLFSLHSDVGVGALVGAGTLGIRNNTRNCTNDTKLLI